VSSFSFNDRRKTKREVRRDPDNRARLALLAVVGQRARLSQAPIRWRDVCGGSPQPDLDN